MKTFTTLLLSSTSIILAACVPQQTLEEKLAAAKTPAEREQIAYYECIKNSDYPVPGGHPRSYRGHEIRQWALCDAMHELNQQEAK
jgi:hypothetical protein